MKSFKEYLVESTKVIGYHGTNVLFDKFDPDSVGRNNHINTNGRNNNDKRGFFFVSDERDAKSAAKAVYRDAGGTTVTYKCELTLNNPYTLKQFYQTVGTEKGEKIYNETGGAGWGIFDLYKDIILKDVDAGGYDSIKFRHQGVDFLVVFDVNQINIIDRDEFAFNDWRSR